MLSCEEEEKNKNLNMPDLDSCIPFPIDEATLNDVVTKAKDWALMHGAAMRSKVNFSEDSLQVTKY